MLSPLTFNIIMEVISNIVTQENVIKVKQIIKEEVKLFFFIFRQHDNLMIYVKKIPKVLYFRYKISYT